MTLTSPGLTDFRFGLRPMSPVDFTVLENWELIDKPSLDPYFKTLASDCYDDCIRYLDGQLQALFTNLARQGLLEQTLVVVIADHGESFGEHDLYVHGDSLYRSETHVPLLIMMPSFSPAHNVIRNPVSLLTCQQPSSICSTLNRMPPLQAIPWLSRGMACGARATSPSPPFPNWRPPIPPTLIKAALLPDTDN